MATTEQIHKEIDLIQDVIKRMADNSFKVKAWMMGIVSGLLAFSKDVVFPAKDTVFQPEAALAISVFLVLLVISFWYLDAFFLFTERLYRHLYGWVVENRKITDEWLYDLNTFKRTFDGNETDMLKKIDSKFRIMFSKTLFWFYFFPFLFVVILLAFNVVQAFS